MASYTAGILRNCSFDIKNIAVKAMAEVATCLQKQFEFRKLSKIFEKVVYTHCYKNDSSLIFATVGNVLTIRDVLYNVNDVKQTFVDGSKKLN